MFTLFIVLHVIFCIFLILVILLQTGKGAGIGAAFGGGSQTVFGPRGAGSFIGRVTGVVAGFFMLTSITLAYLSTSRSDAVAKAVEDALKTEKAKQVESISLADKKENDTAQRESTATPTAVKDADSDKAGTDEQKTPEGTDVEKSTEEAKGAEATEAKPVEAPAAETQKAQPDPKASAKPAPKPAKDATPKPAEPSAEVGAETPASAPAPTPPAAPADEPAAE